MPMSTANTMRPTRNNECSTSVAAGGCSSTPAVPPTSAPGASRRIAYAVNAAAAHVRPLAALYSTVPTMMLTADTPTMAAARTRPSA
eukprot:360784-Chlamydomonas_euryale.AAC.1